MSFKILTTSECDVAQVFSAPPSAGASVTIDGTPLVPSPFLNLTLEKYTSGDTITGGLLRVQLSGTVVGASFDEVASIGNGSAQSIKEVLELAANSDCIILEIKCGEQFIKGKGKIITFSASEGNQPSWVNYAPYTVDIELYENLLNNKQYVESEIFGSDPNLSNLLIKDLSEEFTVDINENSFIWDTVPGASGSLEGVGDKHVKVSFSIGAVGLGASCPSSGALKGLEAVEEYMISRLSKLKNMDINGLNNGPDDEIVPALNDYKGESFLDFRSININPIENRMSISGEIIYRPSGCSYNNVFSSLTVEENLTTDGNNITISGNITGLVDSQYDTIIRNTTYLDTQCTFNEKMANANAFFSIIKPELENIAKAHASSSQGSESLFPTGKDYIKDENNVCPPPTGAGDVCYLTSTPMPEPEFCDLRLVSSQISRNYSRGEINFTYTYNNNPNCSIPGARTIEIEATHDMPRDNIVEIVVPGRGQKGVLTQNLCVLSSEKWSFSLNATLITNSCGRPKDRMELTKLRDCAKDQLEEFKNDNGIDTDCWFITDKQEALGNKTYRYNIQYTKPSCP